MSQDVHTYIPRHQSVSMTERGPMPSSVVEILTLSQALALSDACGSGRLRYCDHSGRGAAAGNHVSHTGR